MKKYSRRFLIAIKVIKTDGERFAITGELIPKGLNKRNPLSWLIWVIGSLMVGVVAFFTESYSTAKEIFPK